MLTSNNFSVFARVWFICAGLARFAGPICGIRIHMSAGMTRLSRNQSLFMATLGAEEKMVN